ncbi:monovalent cation/H+ antiporter subunit D family protein [Nitriliruptoraceae bacterium ZYF776]|nr:monovalent cation/H+ antiporter subunit D family protein [Profundirhabdus halotolerans]
MAPEPSLLPLLAVLLPVLTAALIVATRRAPRVSEAMLATGATATLLVVGSMLPTVRDGRVPTTELGEVIPGIAMSLRADGMAMVFALLAAVLWALASIYAVGYLRGDDADHRTRFYAFYALCLGTAFAVAFAGDLLTFFFAYELLTISTYPLVTHNGDDAAVAAGRRYIGYLVGGGVLVLLGTVIVVAFTGEASFAAGGFVGDTLGAPLTTVTFALFAIGFATKAGLMPLHRWLPSAMVAPTPVSALLHAVAVVKAGVFAFGRLIGFVFGPDVLGELAVTTVLAVVAGTTIVVASIIALRQDHLKRRLAYSTIAHLAYIVLGFALLSSTSFEGSLLHILNHGALKITLFFCAGALHVHLHLDHVSELDGVGRRMPFTMTAFAVASLGLAGLPPLGGFLSKWTLVLGAYESGDLLAATVMAFSGLFTAAYLFPIVYRAFFKPSPAGVTDPAPGQRRDASRALVLPLSATAGLALLLGLTDPAGIYGVADEAATAVAESTPLTEVEP